MCLFATSILLIIVISPSHAVSAPAVSGTTPTADTTPTWSWTPGGGGNGNYRYKLNDSDLSSGTTSTTDTFYTAATLSDGTYTLYVQEQDSVGDWSTSGSFTITVDTTGPSAPIVTGTTPTTDTTPTWNWSSGGGGGTGDYRYKLGNNDFSSGATTTSNTFYTAGTLSDGGHTLYVQEQDSLGNWSTSGSLTITVDTTGPNAPVVTGTTPTTDTTPTWNWSSGGGGGTGNYRYKLDNNDLTSGATPTTDTTFTAGTLTDGGHTLYVQEQDSLGNWSNSGSLTITVDTTGPNAPSVTGTSPTADPTPTWSWSSGGGGGSGAYRYKLGDSDLSTGATPTNSTTFTASTLSDGPHTLYVQEQDSLGNWSNSGSFTIAVDTTAPSITITVNPLPLRDTNTIVNDETPTLTFTADDGSGSGASGIPNDESRLILQYRSWGSTDDADWTDLDIDLGNTSINTGATPPEIIIDFDDSGSGPIDFNELPAGDYEIRLGIEDQVGNPGYASFGVLIDWDVDIVASFARTGTDTTINSGALKWTITFLDQSSGSTIAIDGLSIGDLQLYDPVNGTTVWEPSDSDANVSLIDNGGGSRIWDVTFNYSLGGNHDITLRIEPGHGIHRLNNTSNVLPDQNWDASGRYLIDNTPPTATVTANGTSPTATPTTEITFDAADPTANSVASLLPSNASALDIRVWARDQAVGGAPVELPIASGDVTLPVGFTAPAASVTGILANVDFDPTGVTLIEDGEHKTIEFAVSVDDQAENPSSLVYTGLIEIDRLRPLIDRTATANVPQHNSFVSATQASASLVMTEAVSFAVDSDAVGGPDGLQSIEVWEDGTRIATVNASLSSPRIDLALPPLKAGSTYELKPVAGRYADWVNNLNSGTTLLRFYTFKEGPTITGDLVLKVDGNGTVITTSDLAADPDGNPASAVTFRLLSEPSIGRLERLGVPLVAGMEWTLADIQAGNLAFVKALTDGGSTQFQVAVGTGSLATFVASDSAWVSASLSKINTAPTLTLPPSAVYNAEAVPGAIWLLEGATATDPENFGGGSLNVSVSPSDSEDLLDVISRGAVTVTASTITYTTTTTTGTLSVTVGQVLERGSTLRIGSVQGNPDALAALLAAITYDHADPPSLLNGQRQVSVSLSDGDGGSDAEALDLTIEALDQIPTLPRTVAFGTGIQLPAGASIDLELDADNPEDGQVLRFLVDQATVTPGLNAQVVDDDILRLAVDPAAGTSLGFDLLVTDRNGDWSSLIGATPAAYDRAPITISVLPTAGSSPLLKGDPPLILPSTGTVTYRIDLANRGTDPDTYDVDLIGIVPPGLDVSTSDNEDAFFLLWNASSGIQAATDRSYPCAIYAYGSASDAFVIPLTLTVEGLPGGDG